MKEIIKRLHEIIEELIKAETLEELGELNKELMEIEKKLIS